MNCGDRLRCWDYDVGITEEDYDVGTYRQVRPTFIKFPGIYNTHRYLFNAGYYPDASVPCGYIRSLWRIRRWVETTDAPAGTSLHHASRETSPARIWGQSLFRRIRSLWIHPPAG